MSARMSTTWDGDAWDNRDDKVQALPLTLRAARLPDPAAIPPREWLYGTRLIRRYVSVLVAPGGTGKSLWALGAGICLAAGKGYLGDYVHHRTNVWCMNLEDPLEEMERRVAAMMMRHQISADDLRGRLFLHSGRDRRLLMASRSADGFEYMHPDRDAVIAGIRSAEIGCVIVDPYVKSHTLEENSNADMDAAVTAWAEVGEQTGAAILLVHHTRKGAVVDIESSRGGKALTDASRVGLTMAPMTAEEGDQLGVPEGDRWQHVRLDDAKANMAPKAGRAAWFKLEIQSLGNATSEYPNGDHVASIAPWTPPNPMAGITVADINLALDRIAEGPKPGVLYAATRRGRNNDRWVGSVLVDAFGLNDAQASGMLAAWFKSGLLSETTYRDAQERKDRSGVAVDDSKRPA